MTGLYPSVKRPLLHVRDQQASGTDGGTFTSGAWQTRVLNTAAVNKIGGASLSSNQVTLPPGDYEVIGWASAAAVDQHHAKLRDITAGADLISGTSQNAPPAASNYTAASFIAGRFSLSVTSVIELQHRCNTTMATSGYGEGRAAFGITEVFAELLIWKV